MKISIVDNEPKVVSFIKEGLGEYNYDVEIVQDGLSAEKHVCHNEYNLFILDVLIHGINGFDLCKTFKKINLNMQPTQSHDSIKQTHCWRPGT